MPTSNFAAELVATLAQSPQGGAPVLLRTLSPEEERILCAEIAESLETDIEVARVGVAKAREIIVLPWKEYRLTLRALALTIRAGTDLNGILQETEKVLKQAMGKMQTDGLTWTGDENDKQKVTMEVYARAVESDAKNRMQAILDNAECAAADMSLKYGRFYTRDALVALAAISAIARLWNGTGQQLAQYTDLLWQEYGAEQPGYTNPQLALVLQPLLLCYCKDDAGLEWCKSGIANLLRSMQREQASGMAVQLWQILKRSDTASVSARAMIGVGLINYLRDESFTGVLADSDLELLGDVVEVATGHQKISTDIMEAFRMHYYKAQEGNESSKERLVRKILPLYLQHPHTLRDVDWAVLLACAIELGMNINNPSATWSEPTISDLIIDATITFVTDPQNSSLVVKNNFISSFAFKAESALSNTEHIHHKLHLSQLWEDVIKPLWIGQELRLIDGKLAPFKLAQSAEEFLNRYHSGEQMIVRALVESESITDKDLIFWFKAFPGMSVDKKLEIVRLFQGNLGSSPYNPAMSLEARTVRTQQIDRNWKIFSECAREREMKALNLPYEPMPIPPPVQQSPLPKNATRKQQVEYYLPGEYDLVKAIVAAPSIKDSEMLYWFDLIKKTMNREQKEKLAGILRNERDECAAWEAQNATKIQQSSAAKLKKYETEIKKEKEQRASEVKRRWEATLPHLAAISQNPA